MDWKKEIIDQSAHAAGGFVVALPAWWAYDCPSGVALAVLLAGLAGWGREKLQAWRSYDDNFGWKRWVDVAFWLPGGALCWLLFYLL